MSVRHSLEENISHGDQMFPLKIYSDKHINPVIDLYAHWHEEVEILYVEQGAFTLVINGCDYLAQAGDCFMINSHDLHQAFNYKQQDSKHYAIVFHLSLLKSFGFDVCQHKYIEPLLTGEMRFPTLIKATSSTGTLINPLLNQIVELNKHQPFGWELGVKSNLLQVLVTLILQNEMIQSKTETHSIQMNKLNLVKHSLDYIHVHYKEKVLISEIASRLHISTEYYSRIFKLYTGKTPIEYVNDHRIDQATKLLISTEQSVLDIALDCGFENISYFIRKFKSKKGLTPKQFRIHYSNSSI